MTCSPRHIAVCLLLTVVTLVTAGCQVQGACACKPGVGDYLDEAGAIRCTARPIEPQQPDSFSPQTFFLVEQGYASVMTFRALAPTTNANGRTVLLLHGKNFAGYYWRKTARDLAARGYRVIAPDQLGFGDSSKSPELQYSFHQMARNTAALLDKLGIKDVSVVGHSMGGMLATRFALLYPDRVTTLTLVNPIGLEDYRRYGFNRSVAEWEARELKQNYASMKAYQTQSYYAGNWPAGAEEFLEPAAKATTQPDWPIVARVSAKLYDVIVTQPVCYEFADLRVRTTLIIGQRDRTAIGKDAVSPEVAATLGDYPKLGQATAAKIRDGRLVKIENAGHMPQVEAYDEYLAALMASLGDD